jgi:LacI family transcriptional regulator
MRDVAKLAGVAIATVSNVLTGAKPVNRELAARVEAAVASLGYERDRAASQLRGGKTRIIAVLVPSLDNPFFTSIISGLEQAVQQHGYDLIVASSTDNAAIERTRLAALLSWRPAGLIIVPTNDAFEGQAVLDGGHTPFVIVDRLPPGLKTDTVSVDNRQAAMLAAHHLAALGHSRVLVVASTLNLANIRARVEAIRQTFRKARLPPPSLLEAGHTMDMVSGRLATWMAVNDRPSAMIALTNFTTISIISWLGQHYLKIPTDMSLVGFDDYAWMQGSSPAITAVRQPVAQLGAEAWRCLRERIEEGRTSPRTIRLQCDLQVRGSTARAIPAAAQPVLQTEPVTLAAI